MADCPGLLGDCDVIDCFNDVNILQRLGLPRLTCRLSRRLFHIVDGLQERSDVALHPVSTETALKEGSIRLDFGINLSHVASHLVEGACHLPFGD